MDSTQSTTYVHSGNGNNRLIKEISLGALLVLSAFLAGFGVANVSSLRWQDVIGLTPDLLYLLFVIAFVAVFSVFSLLARNRMVVLPSLTIAALSLHLSFEFSNVFLWSIAIGGILFFFSDAAVRSGFDASAKIKISAILGKNLGLFFTALALIFSFIYYSGFKKDADIVELLFLNRDIFSSIVEKIQPATETILPNFGPSDTVDEFIENALKQGLKDSGITTISAETIKSEVIKQRQAYSQDFGIKLTGKEKIIDVVYDFTMGKFRSFMAPFKGRIPVVLAIVIFFTVRSFSFVFYYLSLPLIYLIVWLLKQSGFVREEIRQVDKEVYVL